MLKKNVIKKSALAPTVLISGGAGFIGYYLTEAFLEKGARVVVADVIQNLENNRVAKFTKNPKFALFELSPTGILPPEIESVDYIIHVGDLERYFVDRAVLNLDTLLVNSQGTKALLDLAVSSSAKFLLLSTIDVFEDSDPLKATSTTFGYTIMDTSSFKTTEARKFAEAVVWEHSRRFGTNVRVVRLPYIYGPKMNLDSCGALGEMLRDLIHRKDITLFGDENRKEHYLYIKDAIAGIVKSLFNPITKGNTYSLVGEDSHKVLTTAFLLRNLADRRTEIEFKDSAKEYPNDIKVTDTSNLRDLDWWPEYSLKEGVISTLEHFGYHVNVHAFKPKELIVNKEREKTLRISPLNPITEQDSLNDILNKVLSNESVAFEEYQEPVVERQKNKISLFLSNISSHISKVKVVRDFFVKSPAISLSTLAIFISALVIFIVVPLLNFNSGIRSAYNSLQKTQESLYKMDVSGAQKYSKEAEGQLEKARSSFSKSKWIYTLALGSEGYSSLNNTLISVGYFIKGSSDLTLALDPYKNIWSVIHPDSTDVLDQDSLNKAQTYIISANNEMQLAKANFTYVNEEDLPRQVVPLLAKYETYLNRLAADLQILSVTSADINSLLGMDSPKTYILWFQNSNEIRPTGGFIGSYGVLTLDKGKIVGLNIDDIYNPDGQIDARNIKMAPPKPIADALAEDRIYLRNSNWSPDLTMSSRDFSELYARVTGIKPDGVIAVDLYFVKNLLDSLGPMYLASYDEEITSANLYERAQYHSDFNYQEGVSDKKAFLTVLGGKLLETVFGLESNKLLPLIDTVYKSLEEKHLMLTFNNNSANIFLSNRNWNGNLVPTESDYLYIVNANLGGTKANYYVKNNYSYTVSTQTRDGLLRGNLVMNYDHTGKDMAWPGGPYKNYVRVLVQKGSKLTGAYISYNGGEKVSITDKVIVSDVGIYDDFEYFFTLNPQEKASIFIDYDLPESLNLSKSKVSYDLFWQKQPGTQDDSIVVDFVPPFGMSVDSVDTNLSNKEGGANSKFSDILNTDKKLHIKLR